MEPLEKALHSIDLLMGAGEPPPLESVFDESFLAQVPATSLQEIFGRMGEQVGACTGHRVSERLSSHSAQVRWSFAGGYFVDGTAAVSENPPGKLVLLRFAAPGRVNDSWAQIEADVKALPGRSSFELRDLSLGKAICSANADVKLCIGSTSKLVIFSCLLDELASGRRRWDDLVRLEASHCSAPTGILQGWPPGSPLTLHTAAVLAISLSDNTAADLLLHELGRQRVQETLTGIGLGDHALLRPFLATRELFQLVQGPASVRDRYRAAGPEERCRMLAELANEPFHADRVTTSAWEADFGWYLTASETCDLLGRIRSQVAHAPTAKSVLGTGRTGIAAADWSFVGFKGGSSPGRLSLALLLEDRAHHWIGASLVVEATPESLDQERCAMLLKRATDHALVSIQGPLSG